MCLDPGLPFMSSYSLRQRKAGILLMTEGFGAFFPLQYMRFALCFYNHQNFSQCSQREHVILKINSLSVFLK
jgi:hypothetical protein